MRWLPLLYVLLFGLLALILPLLRLQRQHGVWGIARPRDPTHRAMVSALLTAVGLFLIWSLAAGLAPDRLDLWAAPGWVPLVGAAIGVAGLAPDRLDLWAAPGWVQLVGAAIGGGGLALVGAAQARMGASWRIGVPEERTGLVTTGLYAWVRHPIYTGLFALLAALVLLTPAPWTVMGALWLGSLLGIQARLEEAHLLRLHGGPFQAWAARTGRFLPGLGRLDPEAA